MTIYLSSIRDLLRQGVRAVWARATDHTRRPVEACCHCVHREGTDDD